MEKAGKLISIIIGLALAAVVVFFGFRIFQQRFGQASAAPTIRTENITGTSFNVVCEGTSANCDGQIMYDTTCSPNLTLFAAPASVETTDAGTTRVTYVVDLRTPDTDYFFKLRAGATTFDNAGTCYTARTTNGVDAQPTSLTPGPSGTATASASPAPTGQVGFFAPVDQVTDCAVILGADGANLDKADGYNAFNYMKCIQKKSTTPGAQ